MIKYDPDILWDLQCAIGDAWDIDGISGDSLSKTMNKFDLVITRAPTISELTYEAEAETMSIKDTRSLEEQIAHWREIRAKIASWRK